MTMERIPYDDEGATETDDESVSSAREYVNWAIDGDTSDEEDFNPFIG
jgi:hypothetical protein